MSSARKPSGFLQQNYDKLVVVIVLVLIIASGITLSLMWQGGADELRSAESELTALNPRDVVAMDDSVLTNLAQTLRTPFQIAPAQRRMLVGDLRVSSIPDGLPIPFDAAVCPFTGTAQPKIVDVRDLDTDGDMMPDVWETKYGFNPHDPADAGADADGDGFSNLEEFQGSSDPTVASDTPPPPAKLRLIQARTIPFKLRFLGVSRISDSEIRYQLNLRSLEKTYFVKMNEEVEGYTVTGYNEKGEAGPVLSLTQGDKVINLVQNRVIDEQAKIAQMAFLVDKRVFRVTIGESVRLLDHDYKVVDISDIRVLIRDEEAGKDFEIGLISDAERQGLNP